MRIISTHFSRSVLAISVLLILVSAITVAATPRSNGKIAFTSDRDGNREIYVMDPDGLNQTRLTNNTVIDDHPTWSPDGTRIAFVSERTGGGFGIHMMNADGTAKVEITPINYRLQSHYVFYWSMSWSPSGDRLVFEDGDDIFVINIDGTGRRNLTSANLERDVSPTWSPDGSRILYSSRGRLYTVSPDGSNFRPAGDMAYGEAHPSWSPSGERIAFAIDQTDDCFFVQGIYTSATDLNERQTVHGGQECSPTLNLRPTWSPDGTKMLFYIGRPQENDAEVFVKNVDGTGFTQLTNTVGNNLNPSWQPRLRLRSNGKIAFTSDRDGNQEIYVMNADGSSQTRITSNTIADDHPIWSPDGTKIAYVSANSFGRYSIFQMNADGSDKVEITPLISDPTVINLIGEFSMSWSPDGRRITYQDAFDIFVVDITTGTRHNLTSDGGNLNRSDHHPAWSPDGSTILFSSFRFNGSCMAIYEIDPDGTDFRLVLSSTNHCIVYSPGWSADGNKFSFVEVEYFEKSPPATQILIVNADGTNVMPLDGGFPDLRARDFPRWSPDGRTIIFQMRDNLTTDTEIYSKTIDGSASAQLTDTAGSNFHPSWQSLAPTVSVSGRVSRPGGQGLANAVVSITGPLGFTQTATTSTFGYYSFENIPEGATYTISVASRRFRFTPRDIAANGNLTDVDLVGQE